MSLLQIQKGLCRGIHNENLNEHAGPGTRTDRKVGPCFHPEDTSVENVPRLFLVMYGKMCYSVRERSWYDETD